LGAERLMQNGLHRAQMALGLLERRRRE